MNLHIRDRWFALCGIASVVIELAGTFVQMGKNDTHSLTWSSSSAAITQAFSHHATTTVWIGAYLEILSMGLFLVFALWAARKLGGGLLGSIASGFAVANVAISLMSLALLDAAAYLAGNGLPLSTARMLVTVNGAAFVTTWFLSAFYLLAITPLALAQGRRIVGCSAAGIAAITLVSVAADPNNIGQMSSLLALLWVTGTSIALSRRESRPAPLPAVAV
jgi:hypothetical protein